MSRYITQLANGVIKNVWNLNFQWLNTLFTILSLQNDISYLIMTYELMTNTRSSVEKCNKINDKNEQHKMSWHLYRIHYNWITN